MTCVNVGDRTAGGGPSSSTFANNPQWIIQSVSGPTDVFIALTQEDSRKSGRPFFHMALWLLKTSSVSESVRLLCC